MVGKEDRKGIGKGATPEKTERLLRRALLALLVVLLALSIWINGRSAVTLDGRSFVRRDALHFRADAGNEVILSKDGDGTTFSIRLRNEETTARLTWLSSGEPSEARIEFPGGEIVEGRWNGACLTAPDGMPLWMNEITIPINDEPVPLSKPALADALCQMDLDAAESAGSPWLTVLGALTYLLGMAQLLWPVKAHFFLSRWRYRNVELSDEGLLAEKISGIVVMALSAFIMLAPLFIR